MSGLLWRSSLRHLARHPWQAGLSVLGVALGVAVVFSIDLVNQSAMTAFRLSTEAVTGRATHHIVAGQRGIPDSVYTRLRVDLGLHQTAPVVDGYVGIKHYPGRAFQFLGIDPFAEAPFRAPLQGIRFLDQRTLGPFLLEKGAVYMPRPLASELGLAEGSAVELRVGGRTAVVTVIGLFDVESGQVRGLENVLIADISTAQEVLRMTERLSRIDLIVPEEDPRGVLDRIRDVLPAGADIVRSASRSEKIEKMTVAFTQNLLALSLLALVVGMFLIYNTMTFSVVQRRGLIGDLRTLGVTRDSIFALVLTEAFVIGLIGDQEAVQRQLRYRLCPSHDSTSLPSPQRSLRPPP